MNKQEIAMSNETDLDWLARNVHKWQGAERCVSVCNGVIRWTVGSKPMDGLAWFTKHEWLARRAELQNKPRWGSVGIEINFISQHEDGQWIGHSEKPKEGGECFECNCIVSLFGYGEVLGDWRDTLEKRPEEFKPFTSIEDNHEQKMKQDNGWFERGELPPVGEACEIHHKFWADESHHKVKISAITDEYLIVKYESFEHHYLINDIEFRPIRTEREAAIEDMVSVMSATKRANFDINAAALYDAGYRKESK